MNKFWEWMENKGYGIANYHADEPNEESQRDGLSIFGDGKYGGYAFPTKQMLLGYMMEFMDEHYPFWDMDELKESTVEKISTEARYNWLEQKINELEQEGKK